MDHKQQKEDELLKLAKLRQQTVYEGYKGLADYDDGYHECDYVSPYSHSAHNTDAEVFIILQDWTSDECMPGKDEETKRLGYTPSVQTNIRLINYLQKYLNLELKDTYATNLFPFIKMGGMSAKIPQKDMRKAANDFTLPMINILKPKIAVALGKATYDALWDNCHGKNEHYNHSFTYKNTKILYQPHPAARISNERKEQGWLAMRHYLDKQQL